MLVSQLIRMRASFDLPCPHFNIAAASPGSWLQSCLQVTRMCRRFWYGGLTSCVQKLHRLDAQAWSSSETDPNRITSGSLLSRPLSQRRPCNLAISVAGNKTARYSKCCAMSASHLIFCQAACVIRASGATQAGFEFRYQA